MYDLLDVVPYAESAAELRALEDRMRYEKFVSAAEKYAAENGMIVGGSAATRLLLNDSDSSPPALGLDSFQYDFYSAAALRHSRGLADALYAADPQNLGHYVVVATKVENELFSISVDSREMFTITSLPTHRGVKISDVVIPSRRAAQFARGSDGLPLQLLCAGPEIQLMAIYSRFADPSMSGEWADLMVTEASLRAAFRREIRSKFAVAIAAAKARTGGGEKMGASEIQAAVLSKFAAGPGRVLVGSAAVDALAGRSRRADGRIRLVTVMPLEAEAAELEGLAKTMGLTVVWRIEDLRLPTEPRMRRLMVRLSGGARALLLEAYNSAAFELVPFTATPRLGGRRRASERRGERPGALKIGSPFVLMRYQLIDIFHVQVLMKSGALHIEHAAYLLDDALEDYERVAQYYDRAVEAAGSDVDGAAPRIFPPTFLGRFEDRIVAQKRVQQEAARFHPPYFPVSRAEKGGAASEAIEANEASY